MMSKKLKLDYLKNENSFRSKIKNTKQTNKNVADTTFKLAAFGWWTKVSREAAIKGATVLCTGPDMTKIFHAMS